MEDTDKVCNKKIQRNTIPLVLNALLESVNSLLSKTFFCHIILSGKFLSSVSVFLECLAAVLNKALYLHLRQNIRVRGSIPVFVLTQEVPIKKENYVLNNKYS